jgi:hypothetical protein
MDPSKRARTEPTAKEDRHECPCKQKNRITCITLKNINGINTAGSVSRLVGTVNTEGSYYEFDVGTSFSVHRHKPCIIRVCAGSVGFRNNAALYNSVPEASVDVMTNIEVQGLAKNMPNSPAGQVVQCEMDVAATNQLPITNLTNDRIYHTTQPYMTRFRCQSLPDKIQLQMLRIPYIPNMLAGNFTRSAPDFISLTLEIEFDE